MLSHQWPGQHRSSVGCRPVSNVADKDRVSDRVQMVRLAKSLSDKPRGALRALAATNPDLVHDWHDELERQKARVEAEAACLAAAVSRLARADRKAIPDAAE